MFKPCTQSVRALPQSTRQTVSEQDRLQSTYSNSHWTSHFAAISSSLKTDNRKLYITGCIVVGKLYSRAGFRKIQFQETRAGRGKNQSKYFISHDCNEVIICAPIKYKKLTYAKILNTSTIYFTRSLVVGRQLRMCLRTPQCLQTRFKKIELEQHHTYNGQTFSSCAVFALSSSLCILLLARMYKEIF